MTLKLKGMTLLLALAFSALPVSIIADHDWNDNNLSYDQARHALSQGTVMPLSEVIKHLRKHSRGEIVATEYEFEFDRWVYEFKVLNRQGLMSMIHIDARDGSLVQVSDD